MVIRSAGQEFSNFRPFVSVLLVCLDYSSIFLVGPFVFLDVRIQMVMPSFPTLLANSSWECLSDVTPVLGPELLHILRQHIILSLSPRTLHHRRVQHFLPTVQALDICPLIQIRSYLLPIFCAKLSDQFSKFFILFGVPISLGIDTIDDEGLALKVPLRIFLELILEAR